MAKSIIVPANWCEDEETKDGVVTVTLKTKLARASLRKTIFANLTFATVAKLPDPDVGIPHPVRIVWDENLKARIVAACAQLQVDKQFPPSPAQAYALLKLVRVPVEYGEVPYRNLAERVLGFISRNVDPSKYPNAMTSHKGLLCWKDHTKHWKAGVTTYEQICNDTSDDLRPTRRFKGPKLGAKRIIDGAISLVIEDGLWLMPRTVSLENRHASPGGTNSPLNHPLEDQIASEVSEQVKSAWGVNSKDLAEVKSVVATQERDLTHKRHSLSKIQKTCEEMTSTVAHNRQEIFELHRLVEGLGAELAEMKSVGEKQAFSLQEAVLELHRTCHHMTATIVHNKQELLELRRMVKDLGREDE